VYNSLKGVYQDRNYALPLDYDCNNGQGWVQGGLVISPWEDDVSTKVPVSCSQQKSCASRRCLYTNVTNEENGTQGIFEKEKKKKLIRK
jgi:hypothetical protein